MAFQEKGRGHRLDWSGSRYGYVAVFREHGGKVRVLYNGGISSLAEEF